MRLVSGFSAEIALYETEEDKVPKREVVEGSACRFLWGICFAIMIMSKLVVDSLIIFSGGFEP